MNIARIQTTPLALEFKEPYHWAGRVDYAAGVVTFADSEELVGNSGLPASALIEVGNDHRLADPEPLEAMLSAWPRLRNRKASLRTRNDGLGLIRVSALLRLAVYGCGDVVVSLAGDDRVVGVGGGAVERNVDHRVGSTRYLAAIDVVAHCINRSIPGEGDGVLSWCGSCARHGLHGWRVRCVARERQRSRSGSARARREGDGEGSGLTGGDGYRKRNSGEHKLIAVNTRR